MKKNLFALFMAIMLCVSLTCAHAAVGDEDRNDEWVAQLIEDYHNREQNQLKNVFRDRNVHLSEKMPEIPGTLKVDAETSPTVRLPASLQHIEDEAFEGTAFIHVEIPEKVESIGENAFANIPTLRSVVISEHTQKIAITAFEGSRRATISSTPNSYARTWANENGIPFAPIAVVYAGAGSAQISASVNSRKESIDIDITRSASGVDSHPQWRPVSEIHADQYEECIANCVSGRAPPACA